MWKVTLILTIYFMSKLFNMHNRKFLLSVDRWITCFAYGKVQFIKKNSSLINFLLQAIKFTLAEET